MRSHSRYKQEVRRGRCQGRERCLHPHPLSFGEHGAGVQQHRGPSPNPVACWGGGLLETSPPSLTDKKAMSWGGEGLFPGHKATGWVPSLALDLSSPRKSLGPPSTNTGWKGRDGPILAHSHPPPRLGQASVPSHPSAALDLSFPFVGEMDVATAPTPQQGGGGVSSRRRYWVRSTWDGTHGHGCPRGTQFPPL